MKIPFSAAVSVCVYVCQQRELFGWVSFPLSFVCKCSLSLEQIARWRWQRGGSINKEQNPVFIYVPVLELMLLCGYCRLQSGPAIRLLKVPDPLTKKKKNSIKITLKEKLISFKMSIFLEGIAFLQKSLSLLESNF